MNWKSKLSAAALATALVFSAVGTAAAQQIPVTIDAYYAPIQFEFEGNRLAPPEGQMGFIYKGSTYVPLRFVAYSLDKAVEWDSDTYTVTVREPSKTESVSIREYKMNRENKEAAKGKVDASKLTPTSISVYFEKIQYQFDGEEKKPAEDLPGLIYQDSLYVPMRFVSESVGKKVDWDPETYTVIASVSMQEKDLQPAEENDPSSSGGAGTLPVPVGGAVSKPSYESLVARTERQLSDLHAFAQTTFNGLKNQYQTASTTQAKLLLLADGWNQLSGIDSQFESIIAGLKSDLAANGYNQDIIETYRTQYNSMKSEEMSKLGL